MRVNNFGIINLYLGNNRLDDGCMKSLGEWIKLNNTMTSISLCQNQISDRGIEILALYVKGNTALKSMDFRNNPGITNESVAIFLDMIKSSKIEGFGVWFHDQSTRYAHSGNITFNVDKNERTKLLLESM